MTANVNYLIYAPDGLILQMGSTEEDCLAQLETADRHVLQDGGVFVMQDVSTDTHYVNTTTRKVVVKGSAPDKYHKFDLTAHQWRDLRSAPQKAQDAATNVEATRRAAYPPLSDLADALYWQSEGDGSKMTTYLAACAAVKAEHPKAT